MSQQAFAHIISSLTRDFRTAQHNKKGDATETPVLFFSLSQVILPSLRNLFIPVFLNCWLAKHALENMIVSEALKYCSEPAYTYHRQNSHDLTLSFYTSRTFGAQVCTYCGSFVTTGGKLE